MFTLSKIILLFGAHALADFPLQGQFLAEGKNHNSPLYGVPWYQCLFAHAMIHAVLVFLITQSVTLTLCELVIHAVTDYAKCDGLFGDGQRAFNIDQAIHYACKIAWAFLS